nr:unnamed protein product [Callosobruchus chinensis]
MSELHLQLNLPLDMRIEEFKEDPERMRHVNEFLDDLFDQAHKEVERRNSGRLKGKLDTLGIQNGSKKIGIWSNRARTSARVFASRIFTTICNCTNQVRTTLIARNNNN